MNRNNQTPDVNEQVPTEAERCGQFDHQSHEEETQKLVTATRPGHNPDPSCYTFTYTDDGLFIPRLRDDNAPSSPTDYNSTLRQLFRNINVKHILKALKNFDFDPKPSIHNNPETYPLSLSQGTPTTALMGTPYEVFEYGYYNLDIDQLLIAKNSHKPETLHKRFDDLTTKMDPLFYINNIAQTPDLSRYPHIIFPCEDLDGVDLHQCYDYYVVSTLFLKMMIKGAGLDENAYCSSCPSPVTQEYIRNAKTLIRIYEGIGKFVGLVINYLTKVYKVNPQTGCSTDDADGCGVTRGDIYRATMVLLSFLYYTLEQSYPRFSNNIQLCIENHVSPFSFSQWLNLFITKDQKQQLLQQQQQIDQVPSGENGDGGYSRAIVLDIRNFHRNSKQCGSGQDISTTTTTTKKSAVVTNAHDQWFTEYCQFFQFPSTTSNFHTYQ
ncbi:hypothetical protein H4219_006199 [Mycoemilia scoparia]|uniref:Uncharacterized protein n=1 Tax=Mycoemilia scoparia TaxID=417184 RepID=A0A9W7ZQ06_9FUNG|nr:hypothetical protein H4219_006199 [Mycoemilia scoparia]